VLNFGVIEYSWSPLTPSSKFKALTGVKST